ncbi:MAG: hypothetical protein WBF67_10670 [Olleya sp.]
MKKLIFIALIVLSMRVNAQAPQSDELVKIHSVTTIEMNAITSPIEGSFVFNTDDKHMYQFDGANWQKLLQSKEIIKPLTASYTLTAADYRCALTFNSSTDVTLTVPAGLPVGYNVSIYQIGSGKVTVIGSGTTIKNRLMRFKSAGLDAAVGLLCTSTNTFHVSGDVKR